VSDAPELAAAIVASLAAGAALLLPAGRRRSAAMALALLVAGGLLVGEGWHTELTDLRDTPALLAGIAAATAAGLVALAALFTRYPVLMPIALVGALPFRIPIETGGESFNLLIPLYVVIAGGVLASLAAAWRDSQARRGSEAEEPRADAGLPRFLAVTLAAAVLLYALQSLYSDDVSQAVKNSGFFLVPFAVMLVLLFEVRWTARVLKLVLGTVLLEAAVFAAVGIWQHEVQETFWNSKVDESNEFHFYFRVNSLFWDPNIYGRYLALGLVLAMACVMWMRDRRLLAGCAALVAIIFTGLAFGFSQTAFVALLAGLGVLAALRWSLRGVLAAAGGLAVAGILFLAFFGETVEFDFSSLAFERGTSGRSDLVEGGLDLAGDRPVHGHGSGSFSEAFRDNEGTSVPSDFASVSHTEPITVAAEQGAAGLIAYVALLVAAFGMLFGGMRAIAPGVSRASGPVWAPREIDARDLARIALAAMFVALVIHTLGYAAFLTDPLTWALLGVGAALASGGTRSTPPAGAAPASAGVPSTPSAPAAPAHSPAPAHCAGEPAPPPTGDQR
jgi:putative inorganic carbon (HCO3(-)) transporter